MTEIQRYRMEKITQEAETLIAELITKDDRNILLIVGEGRTVVVDDGAIWLGGKNMTIKDFTATAGAQLGALLIGKTGEHNKENVSEK